MASVVPGTTEQRLQGLLTDMVWDEEDLNRQRVEVMRGLGSEGDGVVIVDDTGFPKQGRASVGVARQYSGTMVLVANCEVTVNCHYAERTLGWPVSTGLYLPQEWAADQVRRQNARMPETVGFQTKAEIALELLDQVNAWGVRHAAVVADSDYGDNPHFLDWLEARRERYVVEVRANFSLVLSQRAGVKGARRGQVCVLRFLSRIGPPGSSRRFPAGFLLNLARRGLKPVVSSSAGEDDLIGLTTSGCRNA